MNPALRENDEQAERKRPGRQVRPIVVQSVGKPEAVSSLARLLLARRQARLAEVPKDDESRSLLPAEQ